MALLDTEDFLSQTGKAMVGVARLLLHYSKGDKLPRMMDIAQKLKSGNGTIQEAFNLLTKLGAIAVEAHGARGSYLAAIDYPMLWRYAGNEWIIGSMPLPYALRYEGLATALYAQLATSGLPFNMTYQRGALSRGEMVHKGHFHYAVMSLLAAEYFSSLHPDISIIARLPMGSYASEHVLISRVPRNQIRRIGVDEISLDVMLLTDDEFQGENNLEKVPVAGAQILDLLQEGLFDAIIWNRDAIQAVPDNVMLIPLQGDVHKRQMATQAVLIALQDTPVRQVLLSIFSPQQITLIQQEVLSRQKLPRY